MQKRLSRDEARWVFARAAELEIADADTLDDAVVVAAARQAGMSDEAVQRALAELRGGALERAEAHKRAKSGIVIRGAAGGALLAFLGAIGIAQGFNVGDLIPFGLIALPALYVRDRLHRLGRPNT